MLLRAEDIIGLKTLYEHHLEVVEAAGGDPQPAGARILGAEAGRAAGAPMAKEVASTLAKGLEENLVTQVLGGSGRMPSAERNASITNILKSFLSGLKGIRNVN